MAYTTISSIIDPEVLADQIAAKFPDHLVLGNTNLVEVDSTFPLGSPGTQFKLPFWKRISPFSALTEGTAMVPGQITANAEYATVRRAGTSIEVLDTSELVSKADPVEEVAGQLARRAAEFIDGSLVGELENTPNTFDQTNVAVQTNTKGTIDQNAVITGMISGLGDNYATLMRGGALVMHSKVYGDLLKTAAIQNMYQSGIPVIKDGMIPTLLGLPIYLSDLVTTTLSGTTTEYHTYVIGSGAVALFYQRQVMTEFDRDILLQADVIACSVHFAPHLYGFDDLSSTVVAEQNKSIHVVKINSF